MKRIISVILAASLMLCCLAFNASANDMKEGTYSGYNYIARLNQTTSSASIYLSYGNQYTPLSASGSARKIQTSTSVEKQCIYLQQEAEAFFLRKRQELDTCFYVQVQTIILTEIMFARFQQPLKNIDNLHTFCFGFPSIYSQR